ncbi:MAG TPA: nucleotidyltransferase domain-containing protein [Candidatus Hydrogenedentes bacterium]|nr:nucleotidyltransferase domain-containing protein [Candidatus Hydrogenedentota bacterium]HPG69257.1 nucleotidyltransferase domain-containing protein [Candidatus Hydrogenedentota bacterium]
MTTRLESSDDQVLLEMVQILVEAYRPEAIYLFGSRANGTTSEDADYDILVVVPESEQSAYRRCQDACVMLAHVEASKDVLVLTRDEFERKCRVKSSLPALVRREGKLLYAA